MRRTLPILLIATLGAFAAPAVVSQAPAKIDCASAVNQQDMNWCARADFEKVDAELNRLYKQQIDWLEPQSKERLRAAQRAWIVYRDKTCAYEAGPREEGGTMWPLLQYACLETATRQRNATLQSYVACRKSGCVH